LLLICGILIEVELKGLDWVDQKTVAGITEPPDPVCLRTHSGTPVLSRFLQTSTVPT
jgi:hypothetical protein